MGAGRRKQSHPRKVLPSHAQGSDAPVASTSGKASTSGQDSTKPKTPDKPRRCGVCKKKLGLTSFKCRCDGLFCGIHRYSDRHQCSFDYKKQGEEEIEKNNPKVEAPKLDKI